MSADLVTFLRACLDDDERMARLVGADMEIRCLSSRATYSFNVVERPELGTELHTPVRVIIFDEARVLAEVAAKRAIIDIHDPGDTTQTRRWCAYCVEPGKPGLMARMPCQHLRLLATAYAGQPGYQEEWRP